MLKEGRDLRQTASRRPSVCTAIHALTASLGSITDTLNHNRDCACTNDFPSRLKTSTRSTAQEATGLRFEEETRLLDVRTQCAPRSKHSPSRLYGTSLLVMYTGCNRRNVRDFGRVFLRSNYTDITQNTYIQS